MSDPWVRWTSVFSSLSHCSVSSCFLSISLFSVLMLPLHLTVQCPHASSPSHCSVSSCVLSISLLSVFMPVLSIEAPLWLLFLAFKYPYAPQALVIEHVDGYRPSIPPDSEVSLLWFSAVFGSPLDALFFPGGQLFFPTLAGNVPRNKPSGHAGSETWSGFLPEGLRYCHGQNLRMVRWPEPICHQAGVLNGGPCIGSISAAVKVNWQ